MKIKKREFKKDFLEAIEKVAQKHNVQIKMNKIESADDHFESTMIINEDQKTASAKPSTRSTEGPTRREQVALWIKNGVTSPKEIAEEIGTHPSYVSRLIKEVYQATKKSPKKVTA